jgi:hypothetical protein
MTTVPILIRSQCFSEFSEVPDGSHFHVPQCSLSDSGEPQLFPCLFKRLGIVSFYIKPFQAVATDRLIDLARDALGSAVDKKDDALWELMIGGQTGLLSLTFKSSPFKRRIVCEISDETTMD